MISSPFPIPIPNTLVSYNTLVLKYVVRHVKVKGASGGGSGLHNNTYQ